VKAGKGRRNRKGRKVVVPLDPAVVAIFLAQRARCEARCQMAGVALPADGYVFAADGIGAVPWHPRTVSRWFAELRDDAGLAGTRIHDLRHFVISYLLESGVDLATVKDLVGHAAASRTTIDTYAHSRLDSRREATGILARILDLDTRPAAAAGGANVVPLRRERGAGAASRSGRGRPAG
jgi:integrase